MQRRSEGTLVKTSEDSRTMEKTPWLHADQGGRAGVSAAHSHVPGVFTRNIIPVLYYWLLGFEIGENITKLVFSTFEIRTKAC